MKACGKLAASAALLALTACGVTPIRQDLMVHLSQGQGLAAVMLDTYDPLSLVTIEPRSAGGSDFNIPAVPVGSNIYVFAVPAGHYCFTSYQYGQWKMSGKSGELGCFDVPTGGLGYSGTLAPRVENGKVVTHQVMDPAGFRALLTARYPVIAKQFPAP
ncbi:MAG TPA: hypothetical protein VKT74_09270 [Gammaproteobacteria bacterium]|nr:hypothetical protein [Gammaproteobacteria bacterium]